MTTITSACPSCGDIASRDTYDIGSGPELSCAGCEWCWGAEGQALQALDLEELRRIRDERVGGKDGA